MTYEIIITWWLASGWKGYERFGAFPTEAECMVNMHETMLVEEHFNPDINALGGCMLKGDYEYALCTRRGKMFGWRPNCRVWIKDPQEPSR